jgi:hypothetical protein
MSHYMRSEVDLKFEKVDLMEKRFGKKSEQYINAVKELQKFLGNTIQLQLQTA